MENLSENGILANGPRTRTSKAWMQEHVTDPFVQRAKKEGLAIAPPSS